MKDYRVVIPCAGTGSRLGPYSRSMNKALVTIGNWPAIVHIVNKFREKVEIVVLLGYRGDHVRQVLTTFFPKRKFIFVDVDKYEGLGSGLGYSLLKAREHLQCPFVFCSNDTIVPDSDIGLNPAVIGNWIGYSNGEIDYSQYRTLAVNDGVVENINPKGVESKNAYIGLCGVEDYEVFWNTMDDRNSLETGEAFGLKSLDDIAAIEFPDWCDTGNLPSLDAAKRRFADRSRNILEKNDEAIWFFGGRVIKFSVDENFIRDRVQRLVHLHPGLMPTVVHSDRNLYVYEEIPGDIFGKMITPSLTRKLLNTSYDLMWSVRADEKKATEVRKGLYDFYANKTASRVKKFFSDHEMVDRQEMINGVVCPPVASMLDAIDWENLCAKSEIAHYHGDYHSENILVDDANEFRFIDWRQNFGSSDQLEFGDVYYDLAKFYHGLLVSHHEVANGNFSVHRNKRGEFRIDISRKMTAVGSEDEFFDWTAEKGFRESQIRMMTALIFLNIAALHERTYGLFLFCLGRYLLARCTNEFFLRKP